MNKCIICHDHLCNQVEGDLYVCRDCDHLVGHCPVCKKDVMKGIKDKKDKKDKKEIVCMDCGYSFKKRKDYE